MIQSAHPVSVCVFVFTVEMHIHLLTHTYTSSQIVYLTRRNFNTHIASSPMNNQHGPPEDRRLPLWPFCIYIYMQRSTNALCCFFCCCFLRWHFTARNFYVDEVILMHIHNERHTIGSANNSYTGIVAMNTHQTSPSHECMNMQWIQSVLEVEGDSYTYT